MVISEGRRGVGSFLWEGGGLDFTVLKGGSASSVRVTRGSGGLGRVFGLFSV